MKITFLFFLLFLVLSLVFYADCNEKKGYDVYIVCGSDTILQKYRGATDVSKSRGMSGHMDHENMTEILKFTRMPDTVRIHDTMQVTKLLWERIEKKAYAAALKKNGFIINRKK